MKRQGRGRVLSFAVSSALLGGVGIGGCSKHRGPYVNTGPDEQPPQPEEQLHVNPGPDEDPGAADGGAAAGGEADGGTADGGKPEVRNVNPGPMDEPTPQPKPTVIVNTVKQPEPQPPTLEPGTMNVRKVEDEPKPAPKKPTKVVNTVKVADPPATE